MPDSPLPPQAAEVAEVQDEHEERLGRDAVPTARESTTAGASETTPMPSRRYPTLASMAAIAARAESESKAATDVPVAQDPALPRPVELPPAPEYAPVAPLVHRPRILSTSNPLSLVAAAHAALAVAAALSGAVLLLAEHPLAPWLLLLAGLAGVGGWLAYFILQAEETQPLAGGLLLASQIGILSWTLALVGPLPALLALVPALTLLALRCAGRIAAGLFVCAALAVYIAASVLALQVRLLPALQLDALEIAIFNGACLCAGLVLTLVGALNTAEAWARAELLAQARQREIRLLRMKMVQLRQQTEVEAELLYNAADAALRGEVLRRTDVLESVFSPVTERISTASEAIAELRAVRDEHRRLESALRRLTQALERGWLGLRWTWPGPSGTRMDELVALLRTPRPQDMEAQPSSGGEPPALIRIPTTDPQLLTRRWNNASQRVRRQKGEAPAAWGEVAHARTNAEPRVTRILGPIPWNEWAETWRLWQDAAEAED